MNRQRHYVPASPWRYRLGLCLGLILSIPLGYGLRFLGATPDGFKDFSGSVVYEVFWILLLLALQPQLSLRLAALWVFVGTCTIEFLQLWHPPWLQALRATLPGRLVLGNTFSWFDFPAYVCGCFLGWGLAHWWQRQSGFGINIKH